MKFISKFFDILKSKENDISGAKTEKTMAGSLAKEHDDAKIYEVHDIDDYIIESEFPGYVIERNVHPNRFDSSAHPSCMPISYLFSRDGKPTLAILFLKTNQYRAMIARGTYEILDKNNVCYIRFFKSYKNEKDYVINRIHSYLD